MSGSRREQILAVAASLMAERGFHGVAIDDIGVATGVSGPALYRHFAGKQDVLGQLLRDISERLLSGGRQRVQSASGASQALEALVAWHVRFATTEPDLIRVHERDFANMTAADQRAVRRLQRAYIELWVEQLQALSSQLDLEEARAGVQAVFGLLNSTPHAGRRLALRAQAELLSRLALTTLYQGLLSGAGEQERRFAVGS